MLEFVIALVVLLVIVAIMSVGVLMGRKPISGSCGGVGAALGEPDYSCEFCGGDVDKCESSGEGKRAGDGQSGLAYDASNRH